MSHVYFDKAVTAQFAITIYGVVTSAIKLLVVPFVVSKPLNIRLCNYCAQALTSRLNQVCTPVVVRTNSHISLNHRDIPLLLALMAIVT